MAKKNPAARHSPRNSGWAGARALAVVVSMLMRVEFAPGDYYSPTASGAALCVTGISGSNYTYVESPFYDGSGNILFCELNSQHTNDLLWRYNMATKSASVVVTGSGGTQGLYFNAGGQLVTADRDMRQISLRTLSNLSGATAIASTYGGKPFNGPNDLVVDAAGGVFFTDPNFENFSNNQGR